MSVNFNSCLDIVLSNFQNSWSLILYVIFFAVAGISGSSKTGCNSLVLAGGYEDDKDSGHEFTYTGKKSNELHL